MNRKLLVSVVIVMIGLALIYGMKYALNSNFSKRNLTGFVYKKTGRELAINGHLAVSIFPKAIFKTDKIVYYNSKNFDRTPFLTIENTHLNLDSLSLLQQQTHIKQLILNGLDLNLITNQQGMTNWDDLQALFQSQDDLPINNVVQGNASTTLAALSIADFQLKNAHILWHNQQTNQNIEINHISFHAMEFALGKPTAFKLSADIAGRSLKFPIKFSWSAVAKVNEKPEVALFTDNDIDLVVDKPNSLTPLAASISIPRLQVDFNQRSLEIPKLQCQLGEVSLKSQQINLTGLASSLSAHAVVDIEPFDIASVFRIWGLKLPLMKANALKKGALQFQLNVNNRVIDIKDLNAIVDDTQLTGALTLDDNVPHPKINFDLHADTIDLDRYLPVPEKSTSRLDRDLQFNFPKLPSASILDLNVNGKINANRMSVHGVTAKNICLNVSSKQGKSP